MIICLILGICLKIGLIVDIEECHQKPEVSLAGIKLNCLSKWGFDVRTQDPSSLTNIKLKARLSSLPSPAAKPHRSCILSCDWSQKNLLRSILLIVAQFGSKISMATLKKRSNFLSLTLLQLTG